MNSKPKRLFSLPKSLLAVLLLFSTSIFAFTVPPFQGYVTDQALVLKADERAALESVSRALESKTGAQVATLIVKNLDGEPIESAAIKIFEKWKIGQKGKDNGVLFLVSIEDKKMRVEVGYGLEGDLNDGKVGALLDRHVIPYFKQKQFAQGIISGHIALVQTIDPTLDISAVPMTRPVAASGTKELGVFPALLLLGVVVLFVVSPKFRKGMFWFLLLFGSGMFRGGRGGGGSGFGGFGGGRSGGGGASRGW